jgi:large-conductance mechanosensitive channel
MDQTVKTFTSEGADARKWFGRIIMAVILGEAIWNLIVSVMNNLVVPWLGDVVGQSSGLPTSFTQRPYDYPDVFVSVLEFCIAGIVAVLLNYFLHRQRAGRVKPVKSSAPTAPVEPARVIPQAAAAAATTQATSPVAPPAPLAKPDPVTPPAPVTLAPAAPAPFVAFVAPAPVARPVALLLQRRQVRPLWRRSFWRPRQKPSHPS